MGVTREEEGGEDVGGVCLDSKVQEQGHVLRQKVVVGVEVLADGQLSEVIDAVLHGHRGLYATQGTSGGVNSHLTIESGIEHILGLEMQDIVLLAAHTQAVGEEVVVVGTTRTCQRTEQGR